MSRPVATVGGLCLAMLMSTSDMAISMPFAGFLAWTTIALVGASGYRQADRWSRRLAWLALAAFAWSQVAGAHMSHGLVMCSLLLTAYLIATSIVAVRAGELGVWAAAGRTGAVPGRYAAREPGDLDPATCVHRIVQPAPRLRLARTAGALGGQHPGSTARDERRVGGVAARVRLGAGSVRRRGRAARRPVRVARSRARRALVWAFGGAWSLTWVLMLNVIVTAGWFQTLLLKVPFGDVYLHNPGRMRYLSMIAIPVLGAVGLQGLVDRPMTVEHARWTLGRRRRAPARCCRSSLGAKPYRFILLAVAMLAAVPAALLAGDGPQALGDDGRGRRRGASSCWRAPCTRACTGAARSTPGSRSANARTSSPRCCGTPTSPRPISCGPRASSTSSGPSRTAT